MTDCFCSRCTGIGLTCEIGDHEYDTNGYCRDCASFSGGVLAYQRYEKAQREGRACDDHFHKTLAAKAACRTPVKYPDPLEVQP